MVIIKLHIDVEGGQQGMSDNTKEREIQQKLETMTRMAKLVDNIQVIDTESWYRKLEVEQAYMDAYDWLIAHGVQPVYDHDLQRYVVTPP